MSHPVERFFHPVSPAARLRPGLARRRHPLGVTVAGRRFALWLGPDGPAAVDDPCPHRRAPLSGGTVRADGRLACPYHGWHFGPDGVGASPSSPTLSCSARAWRVVERHGWLWIGGAEAPEPPDLGPPGFRLAGVVDRRVRAPLPLVLDNFSEDEHLAWVHTRLGWAEPEAASVEHEVRREADHTTVAYRGPQRASWVLPLLLTKPGDRFENRWVHRFDPVHAIYEMRWTSARTGRERPFRTRSAVFLVPEGPRVTRLVVFTFVAASPVFRPALPLVCRLTAALGRREIDDDARFLATMTWVPTGLSGQRLARFDKPLVHNRRLLDRIYWGERDGSA